MANTILRVYDKFSDAEKARSVLLASGFSSASVQLSSSDDEAGPVEGNFTVGNQDAGLSGVPNSWTGEDRHTYERNYAKVEQRGNHVLTVEVSNDEQLARAADIMDRFNAIDVDERTRRRGG